MEGGHGGGHGYRRQLSESEMSRKLSSSGSVTRKISDLGSSMTRKISDADLYGFIKPREIEEMKPEKEPLLIADDTISPGTKLKQY